MGSTPEREAGDYETVPLDAIPIPLIHYSVRGGTPVLTNTNEAFDSAFREYESGTPMRQWLATIDVASNDCTSDDLCATLAAGELLEVDCIQHVDEGGVEQQTYRLQSRSYEAADSQEGCLMMTPLPSESDESVDVDQIASVISHELRNPLDVAKAHLTAARERGDEEHFEQLADAHDRMERIIQDVLTLARNENAITPSPEVELSTVASDAWVSVETEGASLMLEDDFPTIKADSNRLQRLFENLFRNSVEHARQSGDTNTGGVDADTQLTVRVGTTDESGFFVADNGTGIPREERDQVFKPGYTSSETGVGLGLAIVEQIAEAHGWTVSIASETSGGTRFEFQGLETAA